MTVDSKIRDFLNSLPGVFEADSPSEVLRMAWASCGVECSIGDFTDAIFRYGFKPEQVGNMPAGDGSDRTVGRWLLRLPSKPLPDPGIDRGRRMRNLVR